MPAHTNPTKYDDKMQKFRLEIPGGRRKRKARISDESTNSDEVTTGLSASASGTRQRTASATVRERRRRRVDTSPRPHAFDLPNLPPPEMPDAPITQTSDMPGSQYLIQPATLAASDSGAHNGPSFASFDYTAQARSQHKHEYPYMDIQDHPRNIYQSRGSVANSSFATASRNFMGQLHSATQNVSFGDMNYSVNSQFSPEATNAPTPDDLLSALPHATPYATPYVTPYTTPATHSPSLYPEQQAPQQYIYEGLHTPLSAHPTPYTTPGMELMHLSSPEYQGHPPLSEPNYQTYPTQAPATGTQEVALGQSCSALPEHTHVRYEVVLHYSLEERPQEQSQEIPRQLNSTRFACQQCMSLHRVWQPSYHINFNQQYSAGPNGNVMHWEFLGEGQQGEPTSAVGAETYIEFGCPGCTAIGLRTKIDVTVGWPSHRQGEGLNMHMLPQGLAEHGDAQGIQTQTDMQNRFLTGTGGSGFASSSMEQ